MNYIVQGIILSVFCIAGYYYSFRSIARQKEAIAVLLLMLCALALRVYASSDLYLHEWDERYHALVAKNLLDHWLLPTLYEHTALPPDYHNWTLGHVWLHKQPVPLWLMAASMKAFGINEFAARIPSLVMSAIGVKLVFDIGKHLYNAKVAFIAAFLFSVNGLLIDLASGRAATDHPETAFMFFVLLSVWCSVEYVQRGKLVYNILAGICVGLAILCKWLPALIVLPIWLVLVYEKGKPLKQLVLHGLLLVAAILIVALPWQLYILNRFPAEAAWEYSFNTRHFTEVLDGNGGTAWFFFEHLRIDYGELIYLPLVWFTYKTIRFRKRSDVIVAIWFWIPYIFFSICKTKMNGYTLFAAPAIFLLASNAFVYLKDMAPHFGKYKWLGYAVAYSLILLPVRYCIERTKLFQDVDREPAWVREIKRIKGISIDNDKTVFFNTKRSVDIMFYTNCIAYEGIPDAATIGKLKMEGYNVIVLQ